MSAITEAIELLFKTDKRQDEELLKLQKENAVLAGQMLQLVEGVSKLVDEVQLLKNKTKS